MSSAEHCTQIQDIVVAIEVGSNPTRSEVNVSKDLLANTLASVTSAVPTRCDYSKARPTIYKVPKELKRGDEDEGYEPVAVSIGPFTKSVNSTAQLENYKWCCVRQLLSSHQNHPDSDVPEGLLKSCLENMKRLEPDIRAAYSEDVEGDSDVLAVSMLLDGCFILQRLLKATRVGEKEATSVGSENRSMKRGFPSSFFESSLGSTSSRQENIAQDDDWTQVFGRVRVWQLVATDLLLLENQIPFFVLIKLFELLWSGDGEPQDTLVKGSLRLFRSLCPHMLQRSAANSEIDYRGVHVHHLLHLFYLSVIQDQAPPNNFDQSVSLFVLDLDLPQWMPCAKELMEAGVKFRKGKKEDSFLDIKFNSHKGILKIPPLRFYDFSDKLFRNLIAFEQTYPDTSGDITTYAIFMDCLVNTPEDMLILHLRHIIVNQINVEQDASRFFNTNCAQVVRSSRYNEYLKNLMKDVNDYRGSRLNKWRATLARKYFRNPCVTMSVLAGVLLLNMTMLQTFFTVYPYFYPPK
ncbi:hypothetical protein CFC21_100859 [Triticum aestivum]|uniref:Uncharacterized protein n=2 Tax=Triticum aestivum TaxID=4565 RepID=A0A3B6RTB3_WHEAT|nr:UPF0481 protein At3g47200-like [Triticum aestivum]KAF7099188.1 hypothetical protein CFC21_100859 [Triticum aestivum]